MLKNIFANIISVVLVIVIGFAVSEILIALRPRLTTALPEHEMYGINDEYPSSEVSEMLASIPKEIDGQEILPFGRQVASPETCDSYHPYLYNIGKRQIHVFIELSYTAYSDKETYTLLDGWQGRFNDLIPTIVFTPNDGWELIEESYEDGKKREVYAYKETLEPDSFTVPLCDYVQYTGFTIPAWPHFTNEDLRFNTGSYAATAQKNNEDLKIVWENIKQYYGIT